MAGNAELTDPPDECFSCVRKAVWWMSKIPRVEIPRGGPQLLGLCGQHAAREAGDDLEQLMSREEALTFEVMET